MLGLPFWQPADCWVQFDVDFVMKCWLIKYLYIYSCLQASNGAPITNQDDLSYCHLTLTTTTTTTTTTSIGFCSVKSIFDRSFQARTGLLPSRSLKEPSVIAGAKVLQAREPSCHQTNTSIFTYNKKHFVRVRLSHVNKASTSRPSK